MKMRTLAGLLAAGGVVALISAAALRDTTTSDGAPSHSSVARPNVLLITLDTVRADRIGAYGYEAAATPRLDRLAREGILFADATTQSPLTTPAHAALFTGQYPARLGVKSNASTPLPESALTLAEVLKSAGYRTAGFIGAFILDRQYGFAQGFDVFDATFHEFQAEHAAQVQRRAEEVVGETIKWLETAQRDEPFFAWVHLYDAHAPYQAPAPFDTTFAARPYDGELAYLDVSVGSLLDTLSKSGLLEQTIVMAIGDHGEALGDHGEEDHGIFLYESVLRIPWIVRLPGSERRGSVIKEQVRSIDLAPTVLDLAGGQGMSQIDGESVTSVIRGRARSDPPDSYAETHYPQLHFGWSMLRSLRSGKRKYIDAPRPELYELGADPGEQHNLISERAKVVAGMAGQLASIVQGFGAQAGNATQPDLETIARLRSLGYVGSAAPGNDATRGADPKDKIQQMTRFRMLVSDAIADLGAQRTKTAIKKLQEALTIADRAYDLHVYLGDAWRQDGQIERALAEYEIAARLNPNTAAPHLLAADLYLTAGRYDQALTRLDQASKVEPRSAEVAVGRGRVYERTKRLNEALIEYQRAVTLNPADLPARGRLVSVAMTLGRFELVEPHLRVLLEHNYQPARTREALGYIAEKRGDTRTASAEYRRALELDPGLESARRALARVTVH